MDNCQRTPISAPNLPFPDRLCQVSPGFHRAPGYAANSPSTCSKPAGFLAPDHATAEHTTPLLLPEHRGAIIATKALKHDFHPTTSTTPPPSNPSSSSRTKLALPDHRIAKRGPTAGQLRRDQTTGKRRRRYLTVDAALDLIAAFLDAENAVTPLNAHVTITFDGSGTDKSAVQRADRIRRACLTIIRKTLASHSHPCLHIWTLETAETGLHMHALLHVDPSRWIEIKSALTSVLDPALKKLGVQRRLTLPDGTEWSTLHITPPAHPDHHDEPADFEDRLRMLGYLLKGIDPAALVQTAAGVVAFAELLSFYLQCQNKSQGEIAGAKRSGRSESLVTGRWSGTSNALDWIDSVNARRHRVRRLPGPEVVAAAQEPIGANPTKLDIAKRAFEIDLLRDQHARKEQTAWEADIRALLVSLKST